MIARFCGACAPAAEAANRTASAVTSAPVRRFMILSFDRVQENTQAAMVALPRGFSKREKLSLAQKIEVGVAAAGNEGGVFRLQTSNF